MGAMAVTFAGLSMMDTILYNACPASENDDGTNTYIVSVHCLDFTIVARPLGSGKYEIVRYEASEN